jgi:hypothetical protein
MQFGRLKKIPNATKDFLSRYENDEIEEDMDFVEWIGEVRLMERLQEKAETLKDIRFES